MSVLYSTGPVENMNGDGSLDPSFTLDKLFYSVVVNILNNNERKSTEVIIEVYGVDGLKTRVGRYKEEVEEQYGYTSELEVSELNRFEIQIELRKDDVLASVTGKNALGEIIRELPLTPIKS